MYLRSRLEVQGRPVLLGSSEAAEAAERRLGAGYRVACLPCTCFLEILRGIG